MDTHTHISDTAEQLQIFLGTLPVPCNVATNTLTLTNAQARRLLVLARKGLEAQHATTAQ
jgi:hypothetical protein